MKEYASCSSNVILFSADMLAFLPIPQGLREELDVL
jgi:hypothetical protein